LLEQFGLDPKRKVNALSRGEKVQVALIGAICPEPDLLVLDEPTSGLDPLVRREFIRAVIGAYQEADPGRRTVFISTHMISEFEGLIDEFTIIEQGSAVLTLESDDARERYRKIRASFATEAAPITVPGALRTRVDGREIEVIVNGRFEEAMGALREARLESVRNEALSLEDIFLVTVAAGGL
jgi:ABC-2 type transport system ATP-binding protein